MKISMIAALVNGVVEGDDGSDIKGLNGTESAKPGDLTFAIDDQRLAQAEQGRASCILTSNATRKSSKPTIRVKDPKLSFLLIYNRLNTPDSVTAFIHPTANISKSCTLGKNIWIGSNVFVDDNSVIKENVIIESNAVIKKNCKIGSSCHIHPNVTLYDNTELKNNVILHSGVVVGADGFGYVKNENVILKFPQLGKVIIEEGVEIGPNTTIDRGSLSDTIIGAGTKIDNLCQIAHNVKIGRNVIIAAQSGVSGSTIIGDNVTIAGQVGIADNLKIDDGVTVGAKSGITKNFKKGATIWGIPARPISQIKKQMAVLAWLTEHFKDLSKLVK